MQRLTTYKDLEEFYSLWRYSNGRYELESHSTGHTCEINADTAMEILHHHGHSSKKVYVPSLLERYDRPPQMRQISCSVYSWD